jgi:L-threonylcarbamoyladenylate synthase
VAAAFDERDVEVVDGGPCQVGIESTIVLLDGDARTARILRPGVIASDRIAAVLPEGWRLSPPDGTTRSPGQMAVHYRPDRPLRVEVLADAAARQARRDELEASTTQAVVELADTPDQAARSLYAALRQASQREVGELVALLTRAERDDPAWAGVVNRLEKAASRWIDDSP